MGTEGGSGVHAQNVTSFWYCAVSETDYVIDPQLSATT